MALSLHTAPVGQALDLAAVKLQCRMGDLSDEDAYFAGVLIPAVADRAEASTRRALLTQTWDLVLDRFPSGTGLELPKPPLISVTFVHYLDTAGVTQTWSSSLYLVEAPAGPRCARGRIELPFAGIWPITLDQPGAVTIRFVAGYGAGSDIPPLLTMAMLMDVGTLFENRESVLTGPRQQAIQMPSSTQDIYRTYRSDRTQRLD